MSTTYINEPLTNGKVVLHTTVGDFDIELWSKEAPKACKNFVQLCMEGFYDNCIFYRLVPKFIVQTGDKTGTSGDSIYDEPFADEYHSRLNFTHRGLLACANPEHDKNDSNFFITLDKTPELRRKHSIFGKITGDTIYNLNRFDNFELEGDRPLFPPKILSAEVTNNPFDDIVVRKKEVETVAFKPRKRKKNKTRNLKLLSFDEPVEQEEASIFANFTMTKDNSSKKKKRKHAEISKADGESGSEVKVDGNIDEDKKVVNDKPDEDMPIYKKRRLEKQAKKQEEHQKKVDELKRQSEKLLKDLKEKTEVNKEKQRLAKKKKKGKLLLEERQRAYKAGTLSDSNKSQYEQKMLSALMNFKPSKELLLREEGYDADEEKPPAIMSN